MINFKEHTPIEKYTIRGIDVWVKREDKYLFEYQDKGCPALAKLRGASMLLLKLKEQGVKKIGVYDTKISKAGQGISFICKQIGLECILGFPLPKGEQPAESKIIAEKVNGAKLMPLVAGRTAICYARFKKIIESEKNSFMLPLGLVCRETVDQVKAEALQSFSGSDAPYPSSIVLSVGTGTITAGVALGKPNSTVYGVSCGMANSRQWNRICKISHPDIITNVQLIPPEFAYHDEVDTKYCPFPTNRWYDMKAFYFLCKNINNLPQPICFWNIGV